MPRSRRRDNAGVSPLSWKKHGLLWRAASGQGYAYRHKHPGTKCVIIDMHAGTGEGIPEPQLDLFGTPPAYPTPLLATRLGDRLGADVILCEQQRQAREQLAVRFPSATILADHAAVLDALNPAHRWALVLNDPCGYASHGLDVMDALSQRLAVDWVIVFNEGALKQLLGMADVPLRPDPPHVARIRAVRSHYAWMADPAAWGTRLQSRQMARTVLIKASPRFHYRVLVCSHTLSQALRPPIWEHVL